MISTPVWLGYHWNPTFTDYNWVMVLQRWLLPVSRKSKLALLEIFSDIQNVLSKFSPALDLEERIFAWVELLFTGGIVELVSLRLTVEARGLK